MKSRLLGLTISVLGLWGCSERVADGTTGVETTNGLQLNVLDAAGSPLPDAQVRIRPVRWLAGEALPVDSSRTDGRTDAQGNFLCRALPAGQWRIEVRSPELAAQIDDSTRELPFFRSLRLAPTAILEGQASAGELVRLHGLSRAVRADSRGIFRFDSLPSGSLALTGSGTSGFAWLASGETGWVGRLRADSSGSILFEDFEDRNGQMRYGPVVGGGWWYAQGAAGVAILPESVSRSFPTALVTDSVHGGLTLHLQASNDTASAPWFETGVGMGGAPTSDLTKFASISFLTRGSGRTCLRLTSSALTGNQSLSSCFELSSQWTEIAIPLDSIKLSGTGTDNSTRKAALQSVTGMVWTMTLPVDFWLDEIRLHGLSPRQLWPASPYL